MKYAVHSFVANGCRNMCLCGKRIIDVKHLKIYAIQAAEISAGGDNFLVNTTLVPKDTLRKFPWILVKIRRNGSKEKIWNSLVVKTFNELLAKSKDSDKEGIKQMDLKYTGRMTRSDITFGVYHGQHVCLSMSYIMCA